MKKIGKLLKDKRWRWTAGGVMCLMVASMIFALGNYQQVNAATTIEELNQANGKITSAAEMELLRNATIENETYTLQNDIIIENISASARGIFGGTFDGNGHVITIKNVEIVEEDTMNATDPQMSGLLFGKVTGTVKNVIIDIEDNDASYVRKTKTEYESNTQNVVYEEEKNALIGLNESVSGLDEDSTKAEKVHYALTASEDGTISGPAEGVYTQTLQEKGSRTTTYAPKKGKTNYFGVICGENIGKIQQVLVTGNDVSVAKIDERETLDYSQIVQPGYREEIYQYKQETVSDSGNDETQALSVDGTAYLNQKDYSVKFIDNELKMVVSSPKKAAMGSKITYDVTIYNNSSEEDENVSVSASSAGVWQVDSNESETPANGKIDIGTVAKNASKSVKFVFDTEDLTENVSMSFNFSGSNGETIADETKNADATLKGIITTLIDTTITTSSNDSIENLLDMKVIYPTKRVAGEPVHYCVTITNTSDTSYEKVNLTSNVSGSWSDDKPQTDLNNVDQETTNTSYSMEIGSGATKTVYFTSTPETGEIVFSASVDVPDSEPEQGSDPEQTVIQNTRETQTVSVTCNKIEAIDTTPEEKNLSIAGLEVCVSAPIAVEKGDSEKALKYNIKITNTSERNYSNVKIKTSKDGSWKEWSYQDTPTEKNLGTIRKNVSSDVSFIVNSADDITMNFSVTGECNGGSTAESNVTASILGISTDFYDAEEKTVSKEFENGLKAYLTLLKQEISKEESWSYKLVLENTNEQPSGAVISRDIEITDGIDSWNVSNNDETTATAFSKANPVIPAGKKVVLTKTTEPSITGDALTATHTEQVDIKAVLKTSAYKYTNVTKADMESEHFVPVGSGEKSGEMILPENPFYAGGIAGKSIGFVGEIKQEISLTKADNSENIKLGGIAGKADDVSGKWLDLYMTGGEDYYGEGTGQPSTSANSKITSALSDNWTSYKKYIYPVDTVDVNTSAVSSTEYDLSWLVKNDVKFATGTLANAEIPVTISDDPVRETAEYDYQVAYIARKSMDQNSEDIIHLAPSIMLDESAFYGIKHVYATDGYYHYSMTENDAVAIKYPYDQDNESIFGDRDKFEWKTNIDTVTVTLPKKNRNESYDEDNDKLYYSINIPEVTEEEKASLPMTPDGDTYLEAAVRYDYNEKEDRVYYADLRFGIPEIRYGVTPYIDGHIYPMIVSEDFGPFTRGALTAPIITSFDYYDKDNAENPYVEVSSTAQYESDSRWILNNAKDLEQYTPTFSVAFLPEEPEGDNWKKIKEDSMILKYEDKSGGEPEIVVEKYEETLTLPEVESEKRYYLYMKAESKYHTTVWYCYGPFNIVPKGTLEHGIYGINSTEPDYKITGKEILEGDYLHFTSENNTVLSNSVQYLLSSKEITNFAGLTWKTYNSGTGISLVRQSENDDTLYIYARNVKLAARDSKYGEIKSWVYKFASDSSDVKANPNTISYKEGDGFEITAASTLSYNSNIQLSTITEDASIFYAQSEKSGESLTIKRVETVPDMESDGNPPAGYYNSGNRWYYISAGKEPASLYSAEDGIDVLNKTRNTKELYLSTVALAADVNPSDVLNYAYLIGEQQQVSPPESALITTTIINGKETEGTRAEIAKGATIYFTSMTPNAEILYWIGDKAVGEGQIYDSSKGIKVKGSGTTYTITLMAKEKTPDGMEPTLLDSNYVTFVYDITDAEKTDEPTATPSTIEADPTMVLKGEKILLSSPTTGAVIYYAVDGKEPVLIEDESTGEYTLEEGTGELYDTTQGIVMPEGNNGFFVISAVAVKSGLAPSSIVHFTYAYPDQVQSPYANVNSGNVALNTEVILKNRTQEATIYYTVAYGKDVPEEPTTNSSVFDDANPFIITKETTIKAIAVKNGVVSNVIELKYLPFDQLEVPKASIESGSVISGGTILNLTAAEGTTIHYTTDNSDPTEAGNQAVMTGNSIILNGKSGEQVTIKAYATAEGKSSSEVVTFTYQFSQNSGGVTADVESGSLVSNGAKVNLMTDVTGAEIYYTTDGESPVTNGVKGSNVTIDGTPGSNFTIKAVAILEGAPGKVMTFTYKIKQIPNTPSATPAGGILTVAARVELSSNVESIYYTVDGSEPTKSSIPYTEPILINKTTILKAIAVSEDGEISKEATFVYTAAEKAAAVVSNLSDGSILDPGTVVKLNTATADAQIYYSTDGTEPTLDNLDGLLVYDGDGIEINRSVTIQAVAYKKDLRLSDVTAWTYVVETIPAVEQKKAEAAKLEEEGLRDTDASSLSRNAKNRNEKDIKRSLQDRKNQTEIVFSTDAMPESVSFESVKKENDAFIVSKAKQLFGDSDTVLSSYKFKVKEGSTPVQPKKMIEIVIPIPKGYEDAVLSVAYVSGDKKLTTLPTSRENGVLYAQTTKLGDYVVIGPEKIEETNTGIPYVLILMIVSGITLLGGVVFLINVQWYKYKLRKKNYPKE